jgi:bacterioferritin
MNELNESVDRDASSVRQIRKEARERTDDGAVTANYEGDVRATIELLNDALAAEIVCVLRYKYHYVAACGIDSDAVKTEFLEHAREEQEHADRLAKRINQLGGRPEMNPATVTARSATEYREGENLVEMITEDLVAERIAIQTYRGWIRLIADHDPTTRRLLEDILAQEEEHANDMHDLLVAHQGTPVLTPRTARNPVDGATDVANDLARADGEGMGQPQHKARSPDARRGKA